MEISFKNKRILVTGAGQGIGRGIAIELWRAGAEVVAISRTKSYLDSLQKEYPSITTVALDLADWDGSRKVLETLGHFDCLVNNAALGLTEDFLTTTPENFDLARKSKIGPMLDRDVSRKVLETLGHFDCLGNNAALGPTEGFLTTTPENFYLLMNVNVKSVLNVSQVVAKKMIDAKSRGSIVNISSQASKAALWGHVTYSATKGAIDAMTRVMALELGAHNIRVNAVNPTVIMTEMGRLGWSDPAKAQGMLSKIPLGRFGEVSEVVNAVCFLLSDKASMINGVELHIDGGFLAC